MSNKEKSVEMMPKSNGPLAANVAVNATTTNVESMADGIKADINKRGGSGSNNKKKDKHKNKDETRANNNNNNKNANNNNSKAKSPKVNTHENGLNAPADDVNDDDDEEKIRAVGEELLKRLQCNGTSISVCKSVNAADKLSPKQTATHGSAGAQATATAANDVSSSENPNAQLKSKPLNNNNTNKKNHNNNNSSRAHDKNCQNQQQQQQHPKSMKNVNSSSSNSSSNCTEADEMKIIQCNGTHIEPTETSATPSDRLSSPGASCSTSQTATAIGYDDTAMPSCSSNQAKDNHQPSTSSASMPATEMDGPIVPKSALSVKSIKTDTVEVTFKEYENELQMPDIMRVIQRELSEPYSIYTYRYFIHNWPKLCFLAMDGENCIGAIVCKLDIHRQMTKRGYIAMLAVDAAYRKLKVGTTLVQKAIEV